MRLAIAIFRHIHMRHDVFTTSSSSHCVWSRQRDIIPETVLFVYGGVLSRALLRQSVSPGWSCCLSVVVSSAGLSCSPCHQAGRVVCLWCCPQPASPPVVRVTRLVVLFGRAAWPCGEAHRPILGGFVMTFGREREREREA